MSVIMSMILLAIFGAFAAVAANVEERAAITAADCVQAPPSSNRSCNLVGTYQPGDYYVSGEPTRVSSLEQCALLCQRHRYDCTSFEYNPKYTSCQFFVISASDVYEANSTGKRVYNDRECYDCGDLCRSGQPYRAQLLDNGGFENPYNGPWFMDKMSVLLGGHESVHRLAAIHDTNSKLLLSQSFVACNGKWYEVSLDYKINLKTSQALNSSITVGNPYRVEYDLYGTGQTSGTWNSIRIVFKGQQTPTALRIDPRFDSLDSPPEFTHDILSIDNVAVFRRPAPKPVPGSKSPSGLNGDFENGTAAPWVYMFEGQSQRLGPANVTSRGLRGSKHALKLDIEQKDLHQDFDIANKDLTTTPKTLYLFEADVLVVGKAGISSYFTTIITLSSSGNEAHYSTPGLVASPNSTKLTIKQPLYVDGSLTDVIISFYAYAIKTLSLDNIKLRPISEDF